MDTHAIAEQLQHTIKFAKCLIVNNDTDTNSYMNNYCQVIKRFNEREDDNNTKKSHALY